MDFAELLLPALAVGATVLTGGAAAPAAAGAAEAGAAAATGAAATGAATGSQALTGLAGQVAAESAAANAAGAAGLAGTTGAAAAPSGYASILQPLGSGMSGLADPAVAAGSLGGNVVPALPLGMTSAPGVPGGAQALGTGLSGTGAFAEMPGAGLAAAPQLAKPGLTAEQMGKLGKMMTDQTQGQPQQRAPAAGGGAAPQNRAPTMKAVETPGVAARPSLAQLLYGRK